MIIKCGWPDNDTTNYLVEFFKYNQWIMLSRYRFPEDFKKVENILRKSSTKLLNKKEKKLIVEFIYKCWGYHLKEKQKEDDYYKYIEEWNPHFEIVDSVVEKDFNGEVVFCFVACGGQCIVM